MATLQVQVGSNIRRLRDRRGLTQSQLADAIARSTDLISRIERGSSAASFETLQKLADVLAVPVAVLFGGAETSPGDVGAMVPDLQRLMADLTPDEVVWLTELLKVARARPTP